MPDSLGRSLQSHFHTSSASGHGRYEPLPMCAASTGEQGKACTRTSSPQNSSGESPVRAASMARTKISEIGRPIPNWSGILPADQNPLRGLAQILASALSTIPHKNGVGTLFPDLKLVESTSPYPTMNQDCLISTPTTIRDPIKRLDPLVHQLC